MASTRNILIGSVCIALSQFSFGLMEVVVKASDLKIVQFVIVRYSIEMLLASIWWNCRKPRDEKVNNWYGDSPYIANIWTRGILHSMFFITYYAICELPMGDFQAIFYQAPLLTVLCAWVFLKEKLPNLYILLPSVIMTIIGVLLVAQPQFLVAFLDPDENEYEPLNCYGVFAALISAGRWVLCVLLVRKAVDAHFLQLEFAAAFCGLFITVPILTCVNHYFFHIDKIGNLDFDNPDQWSFNWISFVLLGIFGTLGFAAIGLSVIGYQYGTATMVSWLEYINIPIGFIYQMFVFGDIPNKYEIIGAVLVTIACLIIPFEQLYRYCVEIQEVDLESDDMERELIEIEENKE